MEDTKKMPFHLIVTDNETGETVRELDFDALIGTAHIAKGEAGGLWIMRCNSFAVLETVIAGEQLLDRVKSEHPEVTMMHTLYKISGAEPEVEETEETEN